ncbi:MAG: dTDP-glucose 4,6-dehydratase [Gammaproteobacteria bacterium]|nr:dTDP-glucose 4,6-dehydratase [Gammaproteobacteria bacterium]
MTILVTGGAGFIGANFIIDWLKQSNEQVINFDKLTYAGNPDNLSSLTNNPLYHFIKGDITDTAQIKELLRKHQPRAIINFAAESHVDRSIHNPEEFISTNIIGTFRLLESCRDYWDKLEINKKEQFRFIHISTDEVYGSLDKNAAAFTENSKYEPNSPYSASKASSDHLVRSYFHTYDFPAITTNCSNNYGPYQFPEKLIPLIIHNSINLKALPIYGDGLQVRDWLYVSDHCSAIRRVLKDGNPGEVYNIGGLNEKTNLEIVHTVCDILNYSKPSKDPIIKDYNSLISFVDDRAGHDRRYAINASKIENELNWKPKETFETGISKTVQWYLNNESWVNNITSGTYLNWIHKNYK